MVIFQRFKFWITIVAGILLGIGLLSFLFHLPVTFREILFATSLIFVTAPVLYEAIKGFRENPFSESLLMGLAGVGAGVVGSWAEGAAVLLLYNIAERVNEYTVDRVRNIARSTANLLPKRALLKKEGKLQEVPVESLKRGNIIVIKPGWRVPVDGKIVAGEADIDQSIVTGESMPVAKSSGDVILSGVLSINGSLEVKVEKPYEESTVNRIVEMVTEAHERKAKVERIVDKFSRYYTPSMLFLAASIALVPPLFFNQPFQVWLYRSLIVLVISCPSALLISTPVTVLLGLTNAMRKGVLIKGGKYLEELAKTRVVIYDKTGTITKGKLHVSQILPFDGLTEKDVLRLAATLEAHSSHPIATAIVDLAKQQKQNTPTVSHIKEIGGKGLQATTKEGKLLVGNIAFLKDQAVTVTEKAQKEITALTGTLVGVAHNKKLAGVISIEDELRPEAKETIDTLKACGVKVFMVTGDNTKTAQHIAERIGIDKVYADCLPEDKVTVVRDLKKRFGNTAMIGDGVNDAPTLAAANVGIALGTAGNDIALEAADVALMGSNLSSIPFLIRLGRSVQAKIKLNITLALGIKALTIILGAAGLIPLWFAIVADDGLTLLIIVSALPLLRLR